MPMQLWHSCVDVENLQGQIIPLSPLVAVLEIYFSWLCAKNVEVTLFLLELFKIVLVNRLTEILPFI